MIDKMIRAGFVAAGLLVSMACAAEAAVPWQDPTLGFAVHIPDGWEAQPAGHDPNITQGFQKAGDPDHAVGVSVWSGQPRLSNDQLLQFMAEFATTSPMFHRKHAEAKFDGDDFVGLQVEYEGTSDDGRPTRSLVRFVTTDGTLFGVIGVAPRETPFADWMALSSLIQSFRPDPGGAVTSNAGTATDRCDAARDSWRWFTGSTVALSAGGRVGENPANSWHCQDPETGVIVVNWNNKVDRHPDPVL